MPHDIIDNSQIKLVDVLREKLSVSKKAKFAVGWLFLSGFKELRNEIDNLEKLEILAGSRTNRQTAELMLLEKKWEKAVKNILEKTKYLPEDKRQEILDEEFKGLMNDLSYIKPTHENIEFLRWFLEKLREKKIEIRIYYKEPLHAKLYLFEYKDPRHGLGEAIVGSSNFSVSGFELNTELNVRVLGDENYKTLSDWFKTRWGESEKAEFTTLAQKAIEKSWAFNEEVTPFRIYLRVLHEIFSYKEEKPEIEFEAELYRYQEDAVIDAYRRLHRYNGVFISDVPGLGKTYIGAALLSHLETEGKTAIVVVPPRLIEYWGEILGEFGAAKAKVFSLGKLEEILDSEKYLKRKVVLVDESHHFRNPDIRRYRDLEKICQGKQVILVSATPQNLGIWDIYWQLKLFTPYEANHNFRIYPIELKKYFEACEKGVASIEDLISQIFIRRTRSDIKEYYSDEKIVFPERKGPYRVDYSIDEVYEKGLYEKLKELINQLTYARYNIAAYAKRGEFDPDELQRLSVAGQNLKNLVRINLFRRLESSVKAFKDTLSYHLDSHKVFFEVLKRNKVLIGRTGAIKEIIEQIKHEEIEEIKIPEESYDAGKFEKEKLKIDLLKDSEIFEQMFKLVKDIKPEEDDKLQELIEILKKEPIKDKKVIIFSCFESTVRYLYENLKDKFEKVDFVAGGEKILGKIKRFAPKANHAKIKPEEEIKIFVATEILAEGLNLQDGQAVISYELHWNPVRIIQRIGRIDRIGSEYDEIYAYNFFPEIAAEKEIRVEKKATDRIEEIIQNFGYDEKTIRLDEPAVRKKLFEIYTEKPEGLEEIEEKSTAKYFEFEFQKLVKKYLEEYKKALDLPAMVHCAKISKGKGLIVFCRADDYFRLRLADEKGKIISKDDWEILETLKCGIHERNPGFDKNYLTITEKVKEDFEIEANKREKDKEVVTDPVKKEFERLVDWLKRKESRETKQKFNILVDFLNKKHLNHEQSKSVRRLARSYKRKFGLKKKEILETLEREIYSLLKDASEEVKPEIQPRYAQIIIAEELK